MTSNKYDKLMTDALGIYKKRQLEAIPAENEIDYEFSEEFKKKSEKLIRRQEKAAWWFFQSTGKKAAAIIIAVIIGFTATLSIDAVREPIFNFFYKVFSTHTDIEYKRIDKKAITDYYTVPEVPEGYELSSDTSIHEIGTDLFWSNGKDFFVLAQGIGGSSSINTENGEVKELLVNGINTLFCNNGNTIFCLWFEHGYHFKLIYPAEIGEEYMYKVIGRLIEYDLSEVPSAFQENAD